MLDVVSTDHSFTLTVTNHLMGDPYTLLKLP